MHHHESKTFKAFGGTAVAALLLVGCAHKPPPRQFSADAPYSRNFTGSGDAVCWSVKRALLSQGYMLDRPNESGVMTGSRDQQPTPKLNITTRLQTTCADNRNGTSIVFVTATREQNQLQKMQQSTSMGVGPATLTLPSGSAKVLGTVRRETISDPDFYGQFFALVGNYVDQERLSQAAVPAIVHPLQSESSQSTPQASLAPAGSQLTTPQSRAANP
jgi:Uncharacterized protein conserved in bacteria (DUF2242)